MRLPTWYKLTSLSLYLSQLKHTLMSAMMSNKSCQRIKLNILLKTRVIWKFVFFWVSLWRPVSGHNQGTKALCGVRGGLGSFSGHHGLSLTLAPSQGRYALKVYRRSSELLFMKTCCVKAENFQDAADKKQHKVAESSWQCWWSVARPIIPESGAGWQ